MQTAKQQVQELLDQLPDSATLNDIRYELNDSLYSLYVREQITRGREDSQAGRTKSHADIKKKFLDGAR